MKNGKYPSPTNEEKQAALLRELGTNQIIIGVQECQQRSGDLIQELVQRFTFLEMKHQTFQSLLATLCTFIQEPRRGEPISPQWDARREALVRQLNTIIRGTIS